MGSWTKFHEPNFLDQMELGTIFLVPFDSNLQQGTHLEIPKDIPFFKYSKLSLKQGETKEYVHFI